MEICFFYGFIPKYDKKLFQKYEYFKIKKSINLSNF